MNWKEKALNPPVTRAQHKDTNIPDDKETKEYTAAMKRRMPEWQAQTARLAYNDLLRARRGLPPAVRHPVMRKG